MITADTLGNQVGAKFANVKHVSKEVVRGERTDSTGRPYAHFVIHKSPEPEARVRT
ncbi:hypothetical protein IWX87_003705 [Polaromonas sp. CG_9.7]|nr:hypothetical protein [Polaromonas sp. CG_9.7]MBG6115899.1 hypothetical protein [Polaromonas sp. CG_9.2]